ERCNYVKEAPGWTVTATSDETGCHTAEFTTPTGARHLSTAPPLPGPITMELSEVEFRVGIHLARPAA
ncbi:MAG TPA: HNH endonuclease, partial [Mycobacterium sp.]|nr:HNH endonuclease [Mycobacterium sp.]